MLCVWPNGDFCYEADLEDYLQDHSDDYYYRVLLYPMDNESFDRYVSAVAAYGPPIDEKHGEHTITLTFRGFKRDHIVILDK